MFDLLQVSHRQISPQMPASGHRCQLAEPNIYLSMEVGTPTRFTKVSTLWIAGEFLFGTGVVSNM